MEKIQIIGLNSEKKQILKALMRMGCMEVTDDNHNNLSDEIKNILKKDSENELIVSLEGEKLKIAKAIEFLDKADDSKKALIHQPKSYLENELEAILDEKEMLIKKVEEIITSQEKLNKLKILKNKKISNIDFLRPWKDNKTPLDINSTTETLLVRGVFPGDFNIEEIKEKIEKEIDLVHFEYVNTYGEGNCVLIIYHKEKEEEVGIFIKKYGFIQQDFDEFVGLASQNIKKIEKDLKDLEKKIENEENNLSKYLKFKDKLELLFDNYLISIERNKITEKIFRTEKTFTADGWVPKRLKDKVNETMSKKWDVYIEFYEPAEDEECPVLLSNNKIGEAVEGITNLYSLPNYKEFDPNTIMAPFFILFFGLMLSDGGYGLIMIAIATFGLIKLNLNDSMKQFAKLFIFCGASTVFWGVMFGGWFGIEALSKYSIWINPVEDSEELLKWSLAFGIFHIFVGIGVRGINLIREKKYLDIVFDVLLWYVFFTGAVFSVLPLAPGVDPDSVQGFVSIGIKMLLVGGVLLILTQGRKEKGIIKKIVMGIGSIYQLIGFMSDVLSYSRLLALGLATSVIASIVNDMAAMIPVHIVLKIFIVAIIAVVGHTFNFAINALGAYVHSSRLQYIEFFGKFYKGGGRAFEPFKINTRFTSLKLKNSEK
ncbi:MAG: V-type ATP synthase subunit I [Clostridiales bacterium]